MKKNVKKGLAMLAILCVSISGCSTKKATTQKTTAKKVATTASDKKSETRKLKKTNWIMELDSGHGGVDSGAVGTKMISHRKRISI